MRTGYVKGWVSPIKAPACLGALVVATALLFPSLSFTQEHTQPNPEADLGPEASGEAPALSERDELDSELTEYERQDLVRRSQLDECYRAPEEELLPETIRAGLFTLSCRAVSWADGLFGDEKDFNEVEFGGLLQFGAGVNQY